METQISHFTKDGEFWEAIYQGIKSERREDLWIWVKVLGSERRCECPDREEDRKAFTISARNVKDFLV